jgi:hypothetical protein
MKNSEHGTCLSQPQEKKNTCIKKLESSQPYHTMHKKPSCDKQCIVNQGSDDASDNAAIMTIVDNNEIYASNDNTLLTLLFFFEIMHFTVVSFQLGHISEKGNNDTIIPDMEGRDKDTNEDSK